MSSQRPPRGLWLDFGTPAQAAGTLTLEGRGARFTSILELMSDGSQWRILNMFDAGTNWKRTADGVQECWEYWGSNSSAYSNNAYFYYYLGGRDWTYAKPFATTTDLVITASHGWDSSGVGHSGFANPANCSATTCTIKFGNPQDYAAADLGLHVHAIGTWHQ